MLLKTWALLDVASVAWQRDTWQESSRLARVSVKSRRHAARPLLSFRHLSKTAHLCCDFAAPSRTLPTTKTLVASFLPDALAPALKCVDQCVVQLFYTLGVQSLRYCATTPCGGLRAPGGPSCCDRCRAHCRGLSRFLAGQLLAGKPHFTCGASGCKDLVSKQTDGLQDHLRVPGMLNQSLLILGARFLRLSVRAVVLGRHQPNWSWQPKAYGSTQSSHASMWLMSNRRRSGSTTIEN